MLFQIRREDPLAPKYFFRSSTDTIYMPDTTNTHRHTTPYSCRLETVASWASRGANSSGTICVFEPVFQSDSQTFSSCQCYDSYKLLFIHYAVDGILGSASVKLVYSGMLSRQVCAVQNTSNCTECAAIAASSVHTGYVFFGCLVKIVSPTYPWLIIMPLRTCRWQHPQWWKLHPSWLNITRDHWKLNAQRRL